MSALVYLLALICALWVTYDVWAINKGLTDKSRVLWTLFAFIFNIGAALIYFLSHKKGVLK